MMPKTAADETDAMPKMGADETPEAKTIVLDKSDPDIADAFDGCKVGDMYKVTKDDDNEITLEVMPAEGEQNNEGDTASPDSANPSATEGDSGATYPANSAVERLMRKKTGQ